LLSLAQATGPKTGKFGAFFLSSGRNTAKTAIFSMIFVVMLRYQRQLACASLHEQIALSIQEVKR
jgi:hypothetical protein